MSKLSILTLTATLLFWFTNAKLPAQNAADTLSCRVMFYNTENLFDTYDDTLTADEEFTPEGERHWNNHKFYDKLNKVYKVIVAVGGWEPPALVGLAEIENRSVLDKLVYDTPLSHFGYHIIHHESPDWRGIDVALLYRNEFFRPLHEEAIRVSFPFDTASRTRDILYVKGLLFDKYMIHIFVNHWPSRYGGYLATVDKRNHAAAILKSKTDSLLRINPQTAILIMGDFNDGPADASLSEVLDARPPEGNPADTILFNMMYSESLSTKTGTLKYRGNWDVFDQIVVSGCLVNEHSDLVIEQKRANIFRADFLLEDDETYLGKKPNRTYSGYRYHGGYSDHLPVFSDLKIVPH